MKIIAVSLIIVLVFSLSAEALSTKTMGKLTMIAILSATAFVIKTLVNRDQNEVAELYKRLGKPDRSTEFQEGFNHWRIEWYGDCVYIFRNGVLYNNTKYF